MGPLDVIKKSPLSDGAGWLDVNPQTMQHKKFGMKMMMMMMMIMNMGEVINV